MLNESPARGTHPSETMAESINTSTPLISIVTVVFNALEPLRRTIASVQGQDTDNSEHVIIDGGSTDGTLEYLNSLAAGRVRWISEPDNGIYDAMNKGLGIARGRYVHFLNAGDTFVHPGTLREVEPLLHESPTILMNRVQAISSDGSVQRLLPTTRGLTGAREMFMSAYCHQAAFVRRDAYLAAGGFDDRYRHFADFKALWRARALDNRVVETMIEVARFPLDGVSSDWRHAPQLAGERERLLAELGDPSSSVVYGMRMLKAHLYKLRMMIRHHLR